MSQFVTALSAGIIATVLVSGSAFMPTPAEAAKLSKADKALLKETTVECRAQAKAKKLGWLASRKFVKSCVIQALKDRPNINVYLLELDHPNMKNLPVTKVKDHM
jgi:hypothetical protein